LSCSTADAGDSQTLTGSLFPTWSESDFLYGLIRAGGAAIKELPLHLHKTYLGSQTMNTEC